LKNDKKEKKLSKSERFADGDSHYINGVDPFSERRVLGEIILEVADTALRAL
jgi:hypothetical protein